MLFYQPDEGYRFNSDSIFLYDFVTSFAPRGSLLDVGAGVGVIGLLLSRDFGLDLTMVEIQEKMASYARINAKINGIDANIVVQDFLEFEEKGRFDTVVSNPPFYHSEVVQSDDEHINRCRYNVHLPIEPFIAKVKRCLKPRGHLFFCYDPSQLMALSVALDRAGLRIEDIRFVHPKKDRPAKLVMIHARNRSRARARIWPPFIVYDGMSYGEEAKKIFQKARTHTIKCRIS